MINIWKHLTQQTAKHSNEILTRNTRSIAWMDDNKKKYFTPSEKAAFEKAGNHPLVWKKTTSIAQHNVTNSAAPRINGDQNHSYNDCNEQRNIVHWRTCYVVREEMLNPIGEISNKMEEAIEKTQEKILSKNNEEAH